MAEMKYHQMQQHVRRASLENVINNQKTEGCQYDGTGGGVIPNVGKIDGRARILRPLRQPGTNPVNNCSNIVTPRRPPNVQRSQVGYYSNTQQRPQVSKPPMPATSPFLLNSPVEFVPNSSKKPDEANFSSLAIQPVNKPVAVMSEATFAEMALGIVARLRKEMSNSHIKLDNLKRMTKQEVRDTMESVTRVTDLWGELERLSQLSLKRSGSINQTMFKYNQLDMLVQFSVKQGPSPPFDSSTWHFDVLPEAINERIAIEKNVNCLNDQFRHVKYLTRRQSRLAKPPDVLQKRSSYNGLAGLMKSMDMMAKIAQSDPFVWKFEMVVHPNFNLKSSKCLIEVTFTHRKHAPVFVPVMKALLLIKCGNLEDLTIGSTTESLYDEDGIVLSSHETYRQFTKSAISQIISFTAMTKFTSTSSFAHCNNYLQLYTNCFSVPCSICKKHLYNFQIPSMVTRDITPIICHQLCYKFVPNNS